MTKKQMILFLSWRDIDHPSAGGAEVFTTEMLKRCESKKDYNIVHFSTKVEGCERVTKKDGIIYIKNGNWISVIFHAMMFYFLNMKRIKFVVDQCNTHRFFTPFWVPKDKGVFFIHQLTREIWKIKMSRIFAFMGEKSEDLLLKIYNRRKALTVSNSTRSDLLDVGFETNNIAILPEGVDHKPITKPLACKRDNQLMIYVGRYSEYKGLPDATKAFIKYLKINPYAQFVIIGKKNEDYIKNVLEPLCRENNITLSDTYNPKNHRTLTLLGRVSEEDKLMYMEKAKLLVYPSRREGWGLGVTEAAILGTPSIVYNSAGLRDAVNLGQAGVLCKVNNSDELFENIKSLMFDHLSYEKFRYEAYKYSLQFRWENTASAFDEFVGKAA